MDETISKARAPPDVLLLLLYFSPARPFSGFATASAAYKYLFPTGQ